ncbi:MAG TPA: alpha/beta hydrolase [Thermoanaerobaculia bacterium]|nr:alpha/beta hydrolase [Thermoanaerobaculia bacterium]
MALTVVSTSDVRLALHDLGGNGPRTLLVGHGTGFHGRAYQPLIVHLRGFRAWAPDLRAHGDSTSPRDSHFAWEGLAEDMEAAIAEIADGSPLYAFGHSMGSAVSLFVEARRPGTFKAIYGFEPIVVPPEAPRPKPDQRSVWIEGTRKRRRDFPSLADAVENFSGKAPFAGWTRESLLAYLEHGFHRRDGGAISIKMDPEDEARMYQMSPNPIWDHLHLVACPVVVASGKPAPSTPSAWAARVAKQIPRARLETYDDLTHMGPFEAPERIAEAAQRFFDQVDADARAAVT